jgi:predicted Mrr-cat superfamily restriction endonuclease
VFVGLDFNLAESASLQELVASYEQRVSRASTLYELNSILPQAWRFSHAISLDDYAVVSCNGSALVGKITSPYAMDSDNLGKTRHYYQIESVGVISSANHLPSSLRKLTKSLLGYGEPFGDAATQSTLAGFMTAGTD